MRILDRFTDAELKEIKTAVESGTLAKIIERRINYSIKECPICTSTVEEGKLTLHFEENSLRKKASFCGRDCLQYFLENHTKTKIFGGSEK